MAMWAYLSTEHLVVVLYWLYLCNRGVRLALVHVVGRADPELGLNGLRGLACGRPDHSLQK
jgi:hypothetical protein